jgi:hypothetical protein
MGKPWSLLILTSCNTNLCPDGPHADLPVTDVVATLKARIEQLEAELAAEQQRSAGHRAHYEHERERADLLARSHEKLDIQLKNLRLHLQAGRQAAAPRKLRDWWRCLRATG